jgi:hypothetical protein
MKTKLKDHNYLTRTQLDGKAIAKGEQVNIWKAMVMACWKITIEIISSLAEIRIGW